MWPKGLVHTFDERGQIEMGRFSFAEGIKGRDFHFHLGISSESTKSPDICLPYFPSLTDRTKVIDHNWGAGIFLTLPTY